MDNKTNRDYRKLTADEQIAVINSLAAYQQGKLQSISGKRFLQPDEIETFNEGVAILRNFTQCWNFCDKAASGMYNYDQLVCRMQYLINIVNRRIAKELQTSTVNGESIIVISQQQALRRGRPTEAESLARKQELQMAERAAAISNLTGQRIATVEAAPTPERTSDTSRRKQEPDLFSQAVESASFDDGANNSNNVPDDLKSLREWKWCMPESLANRISAVRDLRTRIAAESEEAKRLLLDGATPSVVEPHTMAARAAQKELAETYAAVDQELALLYVMLTEVDKEWLKMAERFKDKGGYNVLVNELKRYYDKMSETEGWHDAALARAQKRHNDWVAKTTRDPEKEKQIHNIKSYFGRKDVTASEKRLAKMREYYALAQQLGVDNDTLAGFDVLIAATEKAINADNDESEE